MKVKFILRDSNGKKTIISLLWDLVCTDDDLAAYIETDDEILAIMCDDVCIYSQLCSGPITWDEVLGYFA
jgi:hypothetical protein